MRGVGAGGEEGEHDQQVAPPRQRDEDVMCCRAPRISARAVECAFDEALGEAGGTLPVWLIPLNLKIRKPANQRELAEAVGACEATLTHHPNAMDARGAGMNRAPDRLCRMVVVVLCVRVICTLAENDVAGAPLQGSEESRVENRPGYRTVRTRIQPL
jgi:hypothetical protein